MMGQTLTRSVSRRGSRLWRRAAFRAAVLALALIAAACGGVTLISLPPEEMVLKESDLPSPLYELVEEGVVEVPAEAGEEGAAYEVMYAAPEKTVQSQVIVLASVDQAEALMLTRASDLIREEEYLRDLSDPLGDSTVALRKAAGERTISVVIFTKANVVGVMVVTSPLVTANETRAWAELVLQHME